MKINPRLFRYFSLIFGILLTLPVTAQEPGKKWDTDKAGIWYNENPWICGFNYIPANAINYTAMWDKTSYSPEVIERELALAETTGFNTGIFRRLCIWDKCRSKPGKATRTF